MPSKHLIFCHPLLLLPSIFPSIRVFSSESAFRIRWPEYWSFSFSISPSNEYSGVISLLSKNSQESSLAPQSESINALTCSLFTAQLSHPYMTLIRWTFVGKMTSLLFNILSRFAIAILPRSKGLLILWLQSPSALILETKKMFLGLHGFHCFPICLPWSDRTRCHDLYVLNVEFESQLFHFPLSPSLRGSLVPLPFLPLKWYHLHIRDCWYFSQKSWFQLVIHPAGVSYDVLCIDVK